MNIVSGVNSNPGIVINSSGQKNNPIKVITPNPNTNAKKMNSLLLLSIFLLSHLGHVTHSFMFVIPFYITCFLYCKIKVIKLELFSFMLCIYSSLATIPM